MQKSDEEFLKRLMIADASFLTTSEKLIIQNNIDTPLNLALSSIIDISSLINRSLARVSWNGSRYLEKAKIALAIVKRLGINWTSYDCEDFPVMLKEMTDSPYMIFYRGNLNILSRECVSMVGTRKATVSARNACEQFAFDACEQGVTVVSGLAFGIDVCAHKGSLKSTNGKTCAVLPGGIDSIYPGSHTKVAAKILESGGLLLSEYTPGTPAAAFRFVQRDRLIAALSPVTFVVQAPAGSGALITAQFALEYGRDVYFHEAAVSEESQLLDKMNIQNLKAESLTKDISYKLENSVEKYLNDGAPVVKSYEEYCQIRNEAPGTVFCKREQKQIDLF